MIPILEAFVFPPDLFTLRSWEALSFSIVPSLIAQSPFYPDFTLTMKEEGDLAHHTKKSVVKKTTWITDQLGYRNDKFINDPDILLIGDSFFAGSGLSQSETITNKLSVKLRNKARVYSIATGSLNDFDFLYRNGIIKKPKLIIFESVERDNICFSPIPQPGSLKEKVLILKRQLPSCINDILIIADRMLRFYSIRWIMSRDNSLTDGLTLPNISPIDPKMIFYQGKSVTFHSDKELKESFNSIMSYKKYCDSIGVNFLFIPMPDKETVYFDLVPLDTQPGYLFKLDSLLNKNGVSTINTLGIYNKERQGKNNLLYHYDDTHWNSTATELIANEIIKQEHLID